MVYVKSTVLGMEMLLGTRGNLTLRISVPRTSSGTDSEYLPYYVLFVSAVKQCYVDVFDIAP